MLKAIVFVCSSFVCAYYTKSVIPKTGDQEEGIIWEKSVGGRSSWREGKREEKVVGRSEANIDHEGGIRMN